jgi:ATP-binding cassette subfamily F protein uup
VLEDYLDHFAGAVLAVSHDRYFLDRISQKIFAFLGGGKLQEFIGGYAEYEDARQAENNAGMAGKAAGNGKSTAGKKAAERTGTAAPADEKSGGEAVPAAAVRRKLTYSERLELAGIESVIAGLETQVKMYGDAMNTCGSDFAKLGELTHKQQAAQDELDQKLERWAQLEELAEAQPQ